MPGICELIRPAAMEKTDAISHRNPHTHAMILKRRQIDCLLSGVLAG